MKSKVYGFTTTASEGWEGVFGGTQVRVIVRATSRQKVAAAFQAAGMNITVGFLTAYAEATGNDAELENAVLDRVAYQAEYSKGPWHLLPERS